MAILGHLGYVGTKMGPQNASNSGPEIGPKNGPRNSQKQKNGQLLESILRLKMGQDGETTPR